MVDGVELSILQQLLQDTHLGPLGAAELPRFRGEVDLFAVQLTELGVDLNAPPFVLPDELDAQTLADGLTNLFYRLRDLEGPKLSLVWRQVTRFAAEQPELAALMAAGEHIAADTDNGLGAGEKNAYHNRQHTVESLLCAHVLALLDARQESPLSTEGRLLLLFATLIHDWHHDGAEHNGTYFRHEEAALEAARSYLATAQPGHRLALDLIVRASDLSGPHTYARQALAWQRIMARMPAGEHMPIAPPPPAGMESLSPLFAAKHAEVAEIAALLRDADLLPMTALTADYAVVETGRLGEEWARPIDQAEYVGFLAHALARPRTAHDRPLLDGEPADKTITFAARATQIFNNRIAEVVTGHARLLEEMGEANIAQVEDTPALSAEEEEANTLHNPDLSPDEADGTLHPPRGIDLSMFEEAKEESTATPALGLTSLEAISAVRTTLQNSGYFDAPPFVLTVRGMEKLTGGAVPSELLQRISLAEQTADSLQRLHGVSGPVMSAVVGYLLDNVGLRVDDGVYRAASAIAREIDEGRGAGTLGDVPGGERNPYHNAAHILDLLLVADLLGQRATQRKSPASSPLARGLLLLGALICHWHHTGGGNRIDGVYHHFHLQNRALEAAKPFLCDISKELQHSLTILVHSTDPREPYTFSRAAYAFHVGLGPRPDVPPNCEDLARLLGDPALCTLVARLNDAVFVPYVGLGAAYSARSIVQLGREIGMAIDFNFVRKNLIAPMLSRPPYPGEHPPAALVVGKNRIASFTTAEAQAIFNPSLHALLVNEHKNV